MNCYVHKDRPSVAACVSCGNLICTECDVLVNNRHYCKECLSRTSRIAGMKFLRRSRTNRMISGICGGIGEYFGVDPVWIRVATVILAVMTWIFPVLIIYLALIFIIPKE